MAAGDHIIDIIIETADHTGPGMQRAADRLLAFDRRVQQTQQRIRQLTNRGHHLTLDLIDNVTPAGSRVNQMLHRLADRAWNIPLRLNDRITSGIREAEGRLFRLTARAYTVTVNLKDNVTKGVKGIMDGALSSVTGLGGGMMAGAGIGYGLYDTVQTHKEFEAQMSTVGAISGATASELKELTAKAREMGSTSVFSATEAGKAFEYMAMAGWKTEQMMAGIKPLLDLAAAGGTELGLTSDIVTDAMSAFKMDATTENVQMFADVVAKAATSANTDVAKMGYTFQYLATSAGSLGYSIQDTALAIDLVADMGIKGEKAGTGLLAVLNGLSSPSKDAAEAMAQYGISLDDGTGKAKPFRQTMLELREVFKQLSPLEQQQLANTLAGVDGMKSMLAIVGASDEKFEEFARGVDHASDAVEENGRVYQGWAEMVAAKRTDNLEGDLKALSSAWEEFQHTIMTGAPSDFLREFVQGVKSDVEKLNGYLKDGFDIGDAGRIAMDIITQLKNKFLELDGVGSLLAGGALIGGIGMITSKAMKLVDILKEAGNVGGAGGTSGGNGPGGSGAGASSVNSMTVNARSVIVNGHGAPGGSGAGGTGGGSPVPSAGGAGAGSPHGSNQPHGSNGGGSNPPPTGGGSRLARMGKWMGGIGTALTLASSAYDVYATSEYNDQMSEEADWGVQQAEDERMKKGAALMAANDAFSRGEITKEERDKAQADYLASDFNVGEAKDYQERVEQQNTDRQNQSIGGAVGGVVGGVLGGVAGSFVGGPVGTAIGGMAGASAGAEIGEMIGANFSSLQEKAAEAWQSVKDEASNTMEWMGSIVGNEMEYIGNSFSKVKEAAKNEWDYVTNTVGEAVQGVKDTCGEIGAWFDGNVWTPVKDAAITAINFIVGLAATIGGGIYEAVSPIAAWFDENVWTPIKTFAVEKFNAIREELVAAWESIQEGYAEAGAWFSDNVWNPIQEVAAWAWGEISALPAQAAEAIGEAWGSVSGWFDANVWQPIAGYASTAWETIQSAVGAAWESIFAYFAPAASWFDSTVWQPISSAVGSVKSAITSAFESAWSAVTGIWSAAGSWFESNVIAPVKAKFNQITSLGSSITGLVTSGSTEQDAAGTIAYTPRKAIIGEAGPEAVIPLGGSRRNRAIDLWEKVGAYLGMGKNRGEENNGSILSSIQTESAKLASPMEQEQSVAPQTFRPVMGAIQTAGGQGTPAVDALGNLSGIDIPEYNRITEDDRLAVRQAKMDAQRSAQGALGSSGGAASIEEAMQGSMEKAQGIFPIPEFFPNWGGTGQEGDAMPTAAPAVESSKGENAPKEIKIDIGGLSLSMDINGGEGGSVDTNAIMGAIQQNFNKLADDVAMHIAEKASSIWNNQALTV